MSGGGRLWGVARTGEDGKARIFWEAGIGLGELAEEKLGALFGGDEARVKAVGAEAEIGIGWIRR